MKKQESSVHSRAAEATGNTGPKRAREPQVSESFRELATLVPPGLIQRAPDDKTPAAATTTPAPEASTAVPDDILALDLAATAQAAAVELRGKHPTVTFTSGRRDKAEQASAMASNIVSSSNRNWISDTYADSSGRRALQKWVDDNPKATDQEGIAAGLLGVLDGLSDAQLGAISKHLSGQAFDVQPVTENADTIKKDIQALTGITKFLDKEGGLVRWHAQFKREGPRVSSPGDPLEVEADEVAERVSGTLEHEESSSDAIAQMETQFGRDFGDVRIHTGSDAAASAKSLHAKAYTVGQDIVFGAGQYNPRSKDGRKLLAHELTHVVQQGAGDVIHKSDADAGAAATDAGLPAKAAPKPMNVGGAIDSKKIVRIAWTFDDGPDSFTAPMRQVTETKHRITATTWFVMYNKIRKDLEANVAKMLEIQNAGGEIGIHSMHPTDDHVAWFPMIDKPSYPDVSTALKDLQAFHAFLTGKGVRVQFVRLPYGLHSELMSYLRKLKYEGDVDRTARDIIANAPVTGVADLVRTDYANMQLTLSKLGLHLWGGAGRDKPETSELSWEAESSGAAARADNLTYHVSEKRKANPAHGEDRPGKFERTVGQVTETQPRSLVILAHDTTAEDVAEVQVDIEAMDAYARDKDVRIEYYTMAQLFAILRGTPKTLPQTSAPDTASCTPEYLGYGEYIGEDCIVRKIHGPWY